MFLIKGQPLIFLWSHFKRSLKRTHFFPRGNVRCENWPHGEQLIISNIILSISLSLSRHSTAMQDCRSPVNEYWFFISQCGLNVKRREPLSNHQFFENLFWHHDSTFLNHINCSSKKIVFLEKKNNNTPRKVPKAFLETNYRPCAEYYSQPRSWLIDFRFIEKGFLKARRFVCGHGLY